MNSPPRPADTPRAPRQGQRLPPGQVLTEAGVRPEARYAIAHAEQGFTANLPIAELLKDDVLLALTHGGEDLTPEHGWPLRLVVPGRYFWKSAKWIRGLELAAA